MMETLYSPEAITEAIERVEQKLDLLAARFGVRFEEERNGWGYGPEWMLVPAEPSPA